VSGQDLRKGSKILAADGSIVEVAHPPEVSEKRGKVVLQTDKAKFLGLRAFFSQTQSVKSEFCLFCAKKAPKANINRRWSEQIIMSLLSSPISKFLHVINLQMMHTMPFLPGWKSRQITEWST